MKAAENFAERALKINPHLPEALRVLADMHLAAGDPGKALKELERARKVSPRDASTLGRIAAAHLMAGNHKAHDAIVAEVEKHDKRPGVFYFELGQRLEQRRRYDVAESAYKKATALRPELAGPHNALGLLYMRLGKEAEADPLLEKGFKADRFNIRVSNMRKVLRHLSTYKEVKTKHFIIKHDAKTDAALARYMGAQLESL
jgi:tetratricopeptide (TPR) repeat protein